MPLNGLKEPEWTIAHPCNPERVASGVVGDPMGEVGTNVRHTHFVDQQFRQIEGALSQRGSLTRQPHVPLILGHHLGLMTERANART